MSEDLKANLRSLAKSAAFLLAFALIIWAGFAVDNVIQKPMQIERPADGPCPKGYVSTVRPDASKAAGYGWFCEH